MITSQFCRPSFLAIMKFKLALPSLFLFLMAFNVPAIKADPVYLPSIDKVTDDSTTNFFADNAYGRQNQPWISPGGQYFNGVTYLAYQGPAEGAYIAAYNHTSKLWKGPVKVLDNPMGGVNPELHPYEADNHGAPHIAISDDGHINIFAGGHGGCDHAIEGTVWRDNPYGEGCKFRKPFPDDPSHIGIQRHARSLKPEDIFQWEKKELDESGLIPHVSYGANLISGGHIYVIARAGTHTANWFYQKSTDGGKTFEEPVSIFKYEKTMRKIYVTWYVRCFVGNEGATKKKDRIGCVATWHHHRTGLDQEGKRLHGPDRRNIYYIEIETSTGNFYNIHNKQLSSPITFEEANNHALAYQSVLPNFVEPSDATFNKHGDPEVLIHQYINPSTNGWDGPRESKNFLYTAFNSNAGTWNIPTVISEATSSRGLFDKTENKEVSSVMVLEISSGVSFFDGSRSSMGSMPSFTKNNEKSLEQKDLLGLLNIRNAQKEGKWMLYESFNDTEIESFNDTGIIPNAYYMGVSLHGDGDSVQRNRNESSGLWKKCWEATTNEECFVACPINEKPLKVELKPAYNLELLKFRVFKKKDGRWDRILKEKLGELPFSYKICLSASGDFKFKIDARTIKEIDHSTGTSFGDYKLIWGGDVLVEKEYPVPIKKGKVKEVFRFGSL